jgi:hypothetical protein
MLRAVRTLARGAIVAATAAAIGCGAIEGLTNYTPCSSACPGDDATVDVAPAGGDVTAPPREGSPDTSESDDQNEDASGGETSAPIPDATGFDIGTIDAPVVDGTVPTCETSPSETGVFVSPTGSDTGAGDGSGGCGTTPAAACKTITAGIATAGRIGSSVVYVSAGDYNEVVNLVAGIEVQGGWQEGADGGTWTYDCSGDPEGLVTIQAPSTSDRTVVASAIGGSATLTAVTVLSMAPQSVQAGESLYGIFATGSNTQLTLNDVAVTVAKAGNGTTGATGSNGSTPNGCSTTSSGASATTPGGTGSSGPAGAFSSTGYTPGGGGTGGSGGAGSNGTAGQQGATVVTAECTPNGLSCQATAGTCVGGTGTPGCGGTAGGGGGGGGGGGSSVALFVSGGATVIVNGGQYTAGNGGNGGPGGSGGNAGGGGAGATGTTTTCPQELCGSPIPAICQVDLGMPNATAAGGPAGGAGGSGSKGGGGGGGSGGDSYAVVTVSSSVTLNGSPVLVAGTFGAGAGGSPQGTSGTEGHF